MIWQSMIARYFQFEYSKASQKECSFSETFYINALNKTPFNRIWWYFAARLKINGHFKHFIYLLISMWLAPKTKHYFAVRIKSCILIAQNMTHDVFNMFYNW